ncbi:enoyl-CoA hydratase [Bacillaceae bacterium S4-13-58]
MSTKKVTLKKERGIGIIVIDNPPLNVMGRQVQEELSEIVEQIKDDNEVVCVILVTAGEKAFIAGADIKEFPAMMGNPNMQEYVMGMHNLLHEIDDLPKPTIAVLDGLTYGGGCELALAFDMRVAEEQTTIALPEIKLGLFPGGGGTQRLPRLIGEARSKEMMFTGEPISAEKAEQIGLVNHVVPTGKGLEAAFQIADRIVDKSLQALSRIKTAVDEGLELPLREGIKREAQLFEEVFQTKDIAEGVSAFIEKRKPKFTHQ